VWSTATAEQRYAPLLTKIHQFYETADYTELCCCKKKGGFVWGGQKHEEEGELNEKEWAEEGRRERAD